MDSRSPFTLSKESTDVIVRISHLVMQNDRKSRIQTEHKTAWNRKFAGFFTQKKPTEPLFMFLRHLGYMLEYNVEIFVCAIIYLERTMAEKKREQINPVTTQDNHVHLRYLNSLNAYRLLMIVTLITQKTWYDDYFSNGSVSQVYDDFITIEELNKLEIAFMKNIKCNLSINNSQYNHYTKMLGLAAYPLLKLPCLSAEDERILEHQQQVLNISHEYQGAMAHIQVTTDSDDESNQGEYGYDPNLQEVTAKNSPYTGNLPSPGMLQPRPIVHSKSMFFLNSPATEDIPLVRMGVHPTTWMFNNR